MEADRTAASAQGSVGPLPVWLDPLPDELLFGCGLRHDEANGYPSGTTLKAAARYSTGPASLSNPALQYLGTAFDLPLLGAIINSDEAAAEALTFRRELRALFGPAATARSLGDPGGFRVCRTCVATRRFVGRTTALPGVLACAEHGTRLATACARCGRPLRPFAPSQRPFACRCGFDWADGPVEDLPPQEALAQSRVVAAYRYIFSELPPDIVRAAERLSRDRGPRRWAGGSEDPAFRPADLLLRSWFESLAAIVALLVDADLAPRALVDAMRSESPSGAGCHNRACGAGPGEIRLNGRRKGHIETYCRVCGSRFLGSQVIESIDYGHGDPRLSPRSVRNARDRLVRRQAAVAEKARELREARPTGTITVAEVFAAAEIPSARNLRASRLRLVAIAKAVLAGRRAATDGPSEPDPNRWEEHLPPVPFRKRRRDRRPETTPGGGERAGPEPGIDGPALQAFLAQYPDERACLDEIRRRRWPDGFRCPACGGTRATLLRAGRLWHCSACDLQTSVLAGTLTLGSERPLRQWLGAAYLVAANPRVSASDLAASLGVTTDGARLLLRRITESVAVGEPPGQVRPQCSAGPDHRLTTDHGSRPAT
jgi:hypothetical protein